MDIETVKKGFDLMEQGMRILGGGPMDYYVRRLTECYDLLLEKYAPFKVGDRVMLKKTPAINPHDSWGWMSSKHFLVKGAVGTVQYVEASKRGFSAGIVFDDESWVDDKGVVHPIEEKNRHTFAFSEDSLVTLSE